MSDSGLNTQVMEKKTVVLTLDTVNTVLGYLGGRPYVEVFGLVQRINSDVRELNRRTGKDESDDSGE